MPEIIYGGPTSREDNSTAFQVRDDKGKRHMLRKRIPTKVPDEVAARLLGDDAPKGHKFEAAPEPEKAETETSDTSGTDTAAETATSETPAGDAPATPTPTASRRGRAGSES